MEETAVPTTPASNNPQNASNQFHRRTDRGADASGTREFAIADVSAAPNAVAEDSVGTASSGSGALADFSHSSSSAV
jgi:hypothetical protein